MISTPDRVKAVELIDQAVVDGARRAKACEELGICDRTYRRWTNDECIKSDARPMAKRAPPLNKLSNKERQAILSTCHEPEFANLAPGQIVPRLADRGVYIGSESSFYRVLHAADQQHHRTRSRTPKPRHKTTTHCATAANQLWSWDVSYLPSPIRGQFYYLYLIMDVFSRKITGWEVHDCESGENAANLVHQSVLREQCSGQPLVLHSDNGAIQKGSTLRAKLEFLGVSSSFSRPRVSNDNPYSESLFRTCKYCPSYPVEGFESLGNAREWMVAFVHWYNNVHRHSGIKHVTPSERHKGIDKAILRNRSVLYKQARSKHPSRWTRATRNWSWIERVWLNPEKPDKELMGLQKMSA